MGSLKSKISDLENHVLDLRIVSNSKINGEEVKDIIDKKLNVL
jgi:hypothetical protein